MLKRLVKRSLQRCGIRLRFSDLICAEHLKSIAIGPDGHAKVTVREKLVFLDMPEIGDLHDTCTVDQETTFDNFIRHSPDSVEGGRRKIGSAAFIIDWMPNSAITRYALYEHEFSWFPAGLHLQPALFAEYLCEAKTGEFMCEFITPQAFEARGRVRAATLATAEHGAAVDEIRAETDRSRGRAPEHPRKRPADRMANRRAENRDMLHVRGVSPERAAALERHAGEGLHRRPGPAPRRQARARLTANHRFHLTF